jgi:hypothetical protein
MKVIRISGVCLLASLALSAFAVSTASAAHALPEIGRCAKVTTGVGVYTGPNCTVVATTRPGKYEWTPATEAEKATFAGAGSGEVHLVTTNHPTVNCQGGNVSGTYTGPKTATATIDLQACYNAIGKSCTGINAPQGMSEIVSLPLEMEIGFIRNEVVEGKTLVSVGYDFKPKSPSTDLAIYECGNPLETARLEGSVIAKVRPIDSMTTVSDLSFLAKAGAQVPEAFQEGARDTLSTTFLSGVESVTAPSTLSVKAETGTNSVPLEIKALER